MTQLLDSVLTPWRLKWYSRGALFALAVAFLVILVSGSGPTTLTGRIGGDYPAFYSAGQIIADGAAENLYSPKTQSDYQKPLIGDQTGFLPFAYPPHFALLYAPLSELPFRLSYAVHTLALVAALALACALIQRIYPNLIESPYLLFFLALTAYPIIRSVMGAQNTAFSILLIVLCWYKVLHNKHYQAGIFLGLLFFKPQFAVPLTGLFLLSGRWRVWASAGATAIVLFALSTALTGPAWIADWLEIVRTFSRFDVQVNFGELVSWQGFFQALLGDGNTVAGGLGWLLAAATVLGISWVWFAGGRRADFNAQLGLASVCIVLISPHTLYYDSGIALIAFVVVLDRLGRLNPSLILGVWAAGLLQVLSPSLGISLSFLPLVFILALAITHLWSPGTKNAEAQSV
jgi:hypothetical protein